VTFWRNLASDAADAKQLFDIAWHLVAHMHLVNSEYY